MCIGELGKRRNAGRFITSTCTNGYIKMEKMSLCLRQRLIQNNCSFLKDINVFLFDCDGVIWKGTQSIDKAADTVNHLTKSGNYVYFVVRT